MNPNEELIEVDVVQETEDSECANTKCHDEIKDIQSRIEKVEHEIVLAQESYHRELIANLKKDIQIEELEKQTESLKSFRYDAFRNNISEAAISELKAINDSEAKDVAFITIAVNDLYRDDLSKLKNKTYSGRQKEPMTPAKVKILQDLFNERLENDSENTNRKKKFSKCIKTSIEIINKKQSK